MKCLVKIKEEMKTSENGVYIIEVGRCSILNHSLTKTNKEGDSEFKDSNIFTEIKRSSVFGESTNLEVAGLDYFGDIVAGSREQGPKNASATD